MSDMLPNKWMVCVRSMTFNHAPYIEDTMNGFCMQETDFPFVCTIIDDASTDGEPEVIKRYMETHFDLEDKSVVRNEETEDYVLTFARHKTNRNCYFAVLYLKYNHYSIKKTKMPYIAEWHENSKYIALCEGDDYWIDPLKLQKQVVAFEQNPTVTMVHTGFNCINEKGEVMVRPRYDDYMRRSRSGDCFANLLINGNYPLTLTVMIQKEVVGSDLYKKCPVNYDYALFLSAAALGDFVYLPERMGCYRYSTTSAMSTMRSTLSKYYVLSLCYFIRCIKLKKTKSISGSLKRNIYATFLSNCFSVKNMGFNDGYNDFIKQNRWLWKYVPYTLYIKMKKMVYKENQISDILDK